MKKLSLLFLFLILSSYTLILSSCSMISIRTGFQDPSGPDLTYSFEARYNIAIKIAKDSMNKYDPHKHGDQWVTDSAILYNFHRYKYWMNIRDSLFNEKANMINNRNEYGKHNINK